MRLFGVNFSNFIEVGAKKKKGERQPSTGDQFRDLWT